MSIFGNDAAQSDRPIACWLHGIAQLRHVREVNVLVALVIFGALISRNTQYFLTTNNLMGVFRALSLTASIGMVMVIITGGIDLSVGSAMGLAGLVTALCFDAGFSGAASVGAGLGVGMLSRYLSAEPASGFGSELDVIAAAAIGGASLAGGVGSVTGAVIGAALVGVIANGVVLLKSNTYAQQAITGGVILIAVSLDVLRNKLTGGNN